MRLHLLIISTSLAFASSAFAQDAATTGSPVTASEAKKARTISFTGAGAKDIFDVKAGPNDSLVAVEVVEGNRLIDIPGATISAGDKPRRLKTSMTFKEFLKNE